MSRPCSYGGQENFLNRLSVVREAGDSQVTDLYQLDIKEALQQLNSDEVHGLTREEANRRLAEYGPNELVESDIKAPWRILFEQFTETMVLILVIAAVVSAFVGDLQDSIAIVAIVILNALLGFQQEYQAERSMAALKKMAIPNVKVRREGHTQNIPAQELVPGDIAILEAGDMVPADCRLLESVNLRIQESALTGESEPVDKNADFAASTELPLADRKNMVFMGTVVTYGRGKALVDRTGMKTELGNIAALIHTSGREPTPLQRRLAQLGKGLAFAALVLVALVFVLGLLRGEDLRLMFLTAISMAVAAVPEGLPAVVTITLALGAQRMLKRKALIRKLPAVEGLGSVTVICSDKTGTLTENRMTVTMLDVAGRKVDLIEELSRNESRLGESPCLETESDQVESLRDRPALNMLLAGGALSNDAILECEESDFQIIGDPTEGALLVAAARAGLNKEYLERILPRVGEVPFDSERKRMTTLHSVISWKLDNYGELPGLPATQSPPTANDKVSISFTKGAVDSLLEITTSVWVDDRVEKMDEEWRSRIQEANNQLAQSGMRVLGVAFRYWEALPDEINEENLERNLTFIGLIGMIDPARQEVKAAVQTCKTAGIRPVMITGDHPLTAKYIAAELGISNNGRILTGQELDRITPKEFDLAAGEVDVFARVSPEHKFNIVQALQKRGEIVAMTGDGVNDAPALRKADIGVAMGITGTDVAKEAADIVLLDDNFATIVAAVEEGRTIYDNIRKFIKYTMTSNAGEIWVMLLGPLAGMPLPLLPLQILWINLVTDGLPGLALAVEPSERGIMHRPPFHPNENIFGRGMGRHILWVGLLMGLVSLVLGYVLWQADHPRWQTMVFTTLTLSQMGHAMAVRSQRDSLFTIGLLSNKSLLGAVLLTFVLQMAVVYIPFLQTFFNTVALSSRELALCLLLSTIVFWAVELEKWIIRKYQPEERVVL